MTVHRRFYLESCLMLNKAGATVPIHWNARSPHPAFSFQRLGNGCSANRFVFEYQTLRKLLMRRSIELPMTIIIRYPSMQGVTLAR
jgi:hypothetical protein